MWNDAVKKAVKEKALDPSDEQPVQKFEKSIKGLKVAEITTQPDRGDKDCL